MGASWRGGEVARRRRGRDGAERIWPRVLTLESGSGSGGGALNRQAEPLKVEVDQLRALQRCPEARCASHATLSTSLANWYTEGLLQSLAVCDSRAQNFKTSTYSKTDHLRFKVFQVVDSVIVFIYLIPLVCLSVVSPYGKRAKFPLRRASPQAPTTTTSQPQPNTVKVRDLGCGISLQSSPKTGVL
jgi:hypothetical protein